MYGGLPRNYNPKASRHDITAEAVARLAPSGSGFDPALREALADRVARNSPWPVDPRSAKPAEIAAIRPNFSASGSIDPRAAGYDNSPAGSADSSPAELIAEAEALEAKAEALRLRAPILEARQAATMESRSVQIAAEAREAVRLDGLAAEAKAEAGWLTAGAEAEAGRAAEGLPVKTAEAGERIKLTAVIPADMRKSEHKAVLEILEFDLTMQFGGFTISKARGGWLDGSGEFVRDSSQVYSVSFDPAAREAGEAEAKLIGYFVAAGEALGEEWLHIERSTFTACHRKAS